MLTDSTREYLRRIVGLYDKTKKIIIMSFATVLCLIPENVFGCSERVRHLVIISQMKDTVNSRYLDFGYLDFGYLEEEIWSLF